MHPQEALGKEKECGAADIHIHSSVGDGMASIPEILEAVARRGDLHVIAITDHDDISGSYQARELAAQHSYPFEVVPGMEISTLEGHLLALFIEHPIHAQQNLATTITAIHSQGGLCIAPHPMNWLTDSISRQSLEKIVNSSEPDIYLDGIETVNATIAGRISNSRAKKFNLQYNLAETGGSDAHFLAAIGSGITLFPGHSAQELKRSLQERTTQAQNGVRVRFKDIGFIQIIRQQHKSRGFFVRGILQNFTRWLSR
jgi:predicted metal-dependent phosphoesterase TrpH